MLRQPVRLPYNKRRFGDPTAFAPLRRDQCGCPTIQDRAQSLCERISIWRRFVRVIRV